MKLSFSSKDRILIVAPHPDDEAIGCGGILALYGDQCDVLILTDGSKGKSKLRPSLCKDELISMRKKETQDAMKLAGVKKVVGEFSIKFTEAIYDPMEFKVRGVPHFDDGEYFGIICYWENLDGVHNNISAGTVSSMEGGDALVFSVSLPSPGDYVLQVVGVAIE